MGYRNHKFVLSYYKVFSPFYMLHLVCSGRESMSNCIQGMQMKLRLLVNENEKTRFKLRPEN